MSGLINTVGNKVVKTELPTLRILRNFPLFGRKLLMLYFPRSIGSGFSCLPLASLYDSHVCVRAVEGKRDTETIMLYEVRSSKRAEPIMVMATESEARDVVCRLSRVIAPARVKWMWWFAGAVVVFVLAASVSGGSASREPALSIHTPMAPRLAPSAQPTPGVATAPQAPPVAQAAPSISSSSSSSTAKSSDVNDPFGLKLVPATK